MSPCFNEAITQFWFSNLLWFWQQSSPNETFILMEPFNSRAHWYPRIAVYDEKFGWNVDQHLSQNLETLEPLMSPGLPSNYVVEPRVFTEPRWSLTCRLRAKLDIENFKDNHGARLLRPLLHTLKASVSNGTTMPKMYMTLPSQQIPTIE